MSSQYFGFEEDETMEVVDTEKIPSVANKKVIIKPPSPDKIPISEIQALLGKEDTVCETTIDSSMNETSFYADEDTSICQSQMDATMNESFSVDESLHTNFTPTGKVRKNIKIERKRKILGTIENKENEIEGVSTPKRIYKKPVPRSASKNKENQKPKKPKPTKKNIADENYEKLAEEIQKKFEEIENFQLVVE